MLKSAEFYQKSYPAVGLGSTPKRSLAITFGTDPRYRDTWNSHSDQELDDGLSALVVARAAFRPASNRDARSESLS